MHCRGSKVIEIIILMLLMSGCAFYIGAKVERRFSQFLLFKVAEELLKAGMKEEEILAMFNKIAVNINKKNTKQ